MKKYKILKYKMRIVDGRIVYRIKALKDFADVKAGDMGGWVSKSTEIRHDDNSWVYSDSVVINSKLSKNVQVRGKSRVVDSILNGNIVIEQIDSFSPDGTISNNSLLLNDVKIDTPEKGNTNIVGNVIIKYGVYIYGSTTITDNVFIVGDVKSRKSISIVGSTISGNVYLDGDSKRIINGHFTNNISIVGSTLTDNVKVIGAGYIHESEVSGNTEICSGIVGKYAKASGNTKILGGEVLGHNTEISDNVQVLKYAQIKLGAKVSGNVVATDYTQIEGKGLVVSGDIEIKDSARISCNHITILGNFTMLGEGVFDMAGNMQTVIIKDKIVDKRENPTNLGEIQEK